MSILLLTYDLNKEKNIQGDYQGFYNTRDSYPYVKLSESSYAIKTFETPAVIFNKLKPYVDKDDTIYIFPLAKPYSGYGLVSTNNWLENNL